MSAIAYRWLARRDRSRAEMRAYLERRSADPEIIARLLDELTARGWLCEERLAEQVIRSRRTRASARSIRHVMARRGIADDVIAQATAGLERGDLPFAVRLLRKRFHLPAADSGERERQFRFLLNRGFDRTVALKAVRAAGDDDAVESGD